MPSAASLIGQHSKRMKQCYVSKNAAGFLEAAQALRDISTQSLSLGLVADASVGLGQLRENLEVVSGFLPERDGLLSHLGQCSEAFIETVMPAFSVNGFEVMSNIGISNKIDDYLFSEKIRVDLISAVDPSYKLLFWCLRQNRIAQYLEGLETVVDDLLQSQEEAMRSPPYINTRDTAFDHKVQFGFFLHMGDVVKAKIQIPPLSPQLDEKLAKVFASLDHGDPISISSRVLQALIASGLQKSSAAAICNASSNLGEPLNIDLLDGLSARVVVQAFLLSCQQGTAPGIIKHMLTFEAENLLEIVKWLVDKEFKFIPSNIIKSCVMFIATEDYAPEHQDIIVSMLEAAALRIQSSLLRKAQPDYEAIRTEMTRFGVPDNLQFKIGNLRQNRGKILELSLGF